LSLNPEAEYQPGEPGASIVTPWADPSLVIQLSLENTTLLAALNSVRLPPRLNALWHRDSLDLEFIFTTLPIEHDLRVRAFRFSFREKTYRCEFGDASDHLLAIARAYRAVRPPNRSLHRNLGSFLPYLFRRVHLPNKPATSIPTSFWIREFPWDDDVVLSLARHLNFYVTFYDRLSPWVNIIDDAAVPLAAPPLVRYAYGSFPAAIAGRDLDPYLLSIWQTMLEAGDSFRRFLYAYQILEFRAFSSVQDGTLQAIKRVLVTPNTVARTEEAAREIVEIVAADKLQDETARLIQVCKEFVNPDHIWTQIEPNVPYFSHGVQFDGGLTLEPLLKTGATREAFGKAWLNVFPQSIRRIRNALVHGREQRVVVAPTQSNYERLRPWLGPLAVAAQEVLLFGS